MNVSRWKSGFVHKFSNVMPEGRSGLLYATKPIYPLFVQFPTADDVRDPVSQSEPPMFKQEAKTVAVAAAESLASQIRILYATNPHLYERRESNSFLLYERHLGLYVCLRKL